MIYEPRASSDLDYPERRSERHRVCLQGCSVWLEYWAGTTLGVAYRAPLCFSSCVGKFTAPVLKPAVTETTGMLGPHPDTWGNGCVLLLPAPHCSLLPPACAGPRPEQHVGTDLPQGTL